MDKKLEDLKEVNLILTNNKLEDDDKTEIESSITNLFQGKVVV